MADEDLVAVVGMAGRFPGAPGVDEFWANAAAGTECVTRYRREELAAAGVPDELLDDPDYVPAGAPLHDVDRFDAALFGYSPREARLMDPQQRIFLQCAWHALEDAGCDPGRTKARIGVFAGTGMSRYLWQNAAPALAGRLDPLEARLLNDKDFLATTVSYQLDLSGPSVSVQTACSTSLVAAHLAVQSLLAHDSDLALAGGVTIELPHGVGYLHRDGSITSADGHCRPFDHRAAGCLGGSGAGAVVLQRLTDAIDDGRTVHAVIRGSAVNNDGAGKVGFTAPSVGGQAAVIREALYLAGVEPGSIGYVETHGTGTPIGDPIEVEALRAVFAGAAPGSIALGSAKATIGHLDSAAGVASLIRAVCAVRDGVLPASPYFERANPLLELDGSPFRVPVRPGRWPGGSTPRRAGVSSFGIGGTNAHVVVEQPAPARPAQPRPAGLELLVLSAGTEQALEAMRLRLAGALDERGDGPALADVAHTLATGRRLLPHRLAVVAGSPAEAARRLRDTGTRRLRMAAGPVAAAYLFPGQGAQRPGMAAGLAGVAPRFDEELRRCVEILSGFGVDVGRLLLDADADAALLDRTDHAQPALFAHCYALAVQWTAWGVAPQVMAGHSIGEYVAACLAGVFDLPDALRLVARRGALMAQLPAGAMLAVALTEHEAGDVVSRHGGRVALAAVNGPRQCVLSGPVGDIAAAGDQLSAAGVECRTLHTSHAFHSAMVDPILAEFEREVRAVRRRRPSVPFASCVTGALIDPEQATDPAYWSAQARATVRFGAALDTLAADPETLFVEVGPGRGLSVLARRHVRTLRHAPITSLPMAGGTDGNGAALLAALGQAWEVGAGIDWTSVHAGPPRRHARLPGYPFARDRYWLDPPAAAADGARGSAGDETVVPAPATAGDTGAAHLTAAEATVAAVFAEAFGVDEVSPDDDFFGLGGTSLLAAQVMHRLRRAFGVQFPVRYLFDAPQVRELAALVTGGTDEGTGHSGAQQRTVEPERAARQPSARQVRPEAPASLAFSLFYFAHDTGARDGEGTYRFLLETAKLADDLGFTAVWTPERHFHSFGGPYPNPSVLSAALAVATERVGIRAGSVVLPLHHPVRVCEDWSIVDNLSGGRVGISFATGWHGSDFVFAPDAYEGRRKLTWDTIPLIQRLWRGDPVTFPGPDRQPVTPTLFPRPVQPELPVWVTASGNPATFTEAARLGTNVLTSLIGQSPEQLAENIARYRAVRAEHGHDPLAGTVTVMLHAYLETDAGSARQLCREPLREYLRGYVAQQQDMPTNGAAVPDDIETQLDFAYERYSTGAALIGSPDSVRPLLGRLAEAGVDEIACLVDFGMPLDRTLRSIRLLGGLRSGPAAETLPGARRARRTAPMGVDQERMFRLEQVNPAGPANYVTTGLRVRGELRPDLLDAALRVVGERHEVLRTTFGQVGGEPVQLIEPEFRVRLQRHDLSDVPPPDRVRAARRLRTEVARRPFRFDEPVLRVALLRLDEAEHQLAIVQQHMITDWVSFNVFVHELFAVYGDLVRGRPTELPPALPYRAFAERERARLRDGLLDDQLDHWIRDLRDAPEPVTLPLAGPRPAAQTFEGRREWLLLPEQTTQRLAALSRAERVTPFMTAYTALAACLARTSGQDDLVVGSPTANRDWAPEQLMGLLLRPMLLRTRLRPDQSFRSALADVRAVTSRALANAEVPYQALVDRLAPDRDLEWLPLFRLRYLFLRWDEPVTVSGLRLSPLDTDPQTSLYDATVSLWDSTRGAFGRIEYCRDIIARDTVVGTIERFATMLHSAVADPDQRIGDLPDSSPTRFHVDTDELEDYLGTQSVHS